ncbi:ATP synthase subunit I [Rhodoferax sp. 4810]|uniref:ATP synthase subunit I n=1 Tax=Thiospirillum jenense TaxID=1653858 RepID=A0A839H3Z6_9GAMM|nr:ATP synthase subunit I [Thiospirillum jenense]MBB1072985.1 ATP synthase subunit I [Rhodoferax jenense]MBB1124933.1 ATP synthase subunit I [Thiospirillum jenense]
MFLDLTTHAKMLILRVLNRKLSTHCLVALSIPNKQTSNQPQIKQLLRWQANVTVALIVIVLPFGTAMLVSVSIGAVVCFLTNWISAKWIFRCYQAQQLQSLMLRMYTAELIKLTLVTLLLITTFVTIKPLYPLALLGAYFIVQMLPAFLTSRFTGAK